MTLRKASTFILFAASFVAVAVLSAARAATAMPALSIIASVARPMASGGSDATANQGGALASVLGEDAPVYTAADWAKAVSACTKLAALCKTTAPGIGIVRKLYNCSKCRNNCSFAYGLSRIMNRSVHELRHWNIMMGGCGSRMVELTKDLRQGALTMER